MDAAGQLQPDDLLQFEGRTDWVTLSAARAIWQPQLKPGRRKARIFLIIMLVLVLVLSGASVALWFFQSSPVIETGRSILLMQETLDDHGGQLTFCQEGHMLDGMQLVVPANSYNSQIVFRISARAITGSLLDDDIRIVSPLINIDNRHVFSNEIIQLTIPIDIRPDEFALAFFYDRKSGRLEGIPLVELASDHLTLATRHFSDIIVMAIEMASLFAQDVDTGFRPGLDDWQFVNQGSCLEPDGHCAGQSVTAMFYYQSIYRNAGGPRLYGRFDNNNYERRTIDFWEDDSWGYRYASVIQNAMAWDSLSYRLQINLGAVSETNTMAALAFAMRVNGEPQLVAIFGQHKQPNGVTEIVGHAIIAYRCAGGRVYVADPNFLRNANLYITYKALTGFDPYTSGMNINEIKEGNTVLFNEIYYLAQSSLINYTLLNDQYRAMLNGKIGQGAFPECKIEYLQRIDEKTGQEIWAILPAKLALTSTGTEQAGEQLRGMVRLRFTNPGPTRQRISIYNGLTPVTLESGGNIILAGGKLDYTLKLDPGVRHTAFYVEQEGSDTAFRYNNVMRCRISFDQHADLKFKQTKCPVIANFDTRFEVQVKDAPKQPLYRWDFGDGSPVVETQEPFVTGQYQKEDDFTLRVTLLDRSTGQAVAETDTSIEVLGLFGQWQLSYRIENSAVADRILTRLVQALTRIIERNLDLDLDSDKTEVSLRGIIVDCRLEIDRPPGGNLNEDIVVRLYQLTSSDDEFSPDDEPLPGILVLKDDQFVFEVEGDQRFMTFTFKGAIKRDFLFGDFNSGWFNGSFQAEYLP